MKQHNARVKESMTLLVAAFAAIFAATAFADTETVDGVEWRYSVADGAATVKGASPAEGGRLVIPMGGEGAMFFGGQ